mgnify:CR=1 FL=1
MTIPVWTYWRRFVSILVAADRGLKVRTETGHTLHGLCFNPCCGGSGTEGARARLLSHGQRAVSILVAADRGLKARWSYTGTLPDWGFNPCCGGSGTEGGHGVEPRHQTGVVSILVAADRGLKAAPIYQMPITVFEVSILVAADRGLKVRKRTSTGWRCWSFNPCCGGSGTEGDFWGKGAEEASLFQSLLRRIGD